MEFGAATATLPKKVSSGYGGKSPYDGVFAAPVKLRATSFASRFEDYREIFTGGGAAGTGGRASLGSSIPILELPELNVERSKTDEVRRSKLDYAAVFGGFRNLDAAVPFEELFVAEPKKQVSFANGASERSKANGGNQSSRGDCTNYSKETPVVSRPSNDANRINMSYHKVNQGNESGTNGTTHIAQLHAVPAYTRLVEEVNPVKLNRANKSIPAAQDAYSGNHNNEGIKESGRRTKSFAGPSPDNNKNQSPNNGGKVKKRSDSFDLFFDARETSNGPQSPHNVEIPPSKNSNSDAMRSMATKRQTSKSNTSEGAACPDSPSYSDDMVDSNSEAAASVAVLRKAIEEAQLRMNVAKESMRRKKEGFPDLVKRKSNVDLKADVKKEAKVVYKTVKLEEVHTRQTFGESDALPQVSSEVGRPMMKVRVRSDLGAEEMFVAKEAVRETQKVLQSTQTEHQEEVEHKEEDYNAKVREFKEAENHKKMLYVKNTGYWEQENNEEKRCVGNEADACKELANETKQRCKGKVCVANAASTCEKIADETKYRCQEVVDEAVLLEVTPDSGTTDKRLKVNEDGAPENKVTPFHEPEDSKSNLGEQGLRTENEKKVASKPEDDGREVEGSLELEEGERNPRATQKLSEVEKNIDQEQKVIGENVEVSSELEECELTEFLEPIDNELPCSQHGLDLVSEEREIQNLGGLVYRKKMCEAGFLDKNPETEHPCQIEGTENTFGDVYVQETLEGIVNHIHDEEEIYERTTTDSEIDESERFHDVKASENGLEGGSLLMEDNRESVEAVRVTQTDPKYKEIKAEEAGETTETSSNYEPNETEKLGKIQLADTIMENEGAPEVTPEFDSHVVQDDVMLSSDSFEHEDKYEEPESVQDTSDSFQDEHKYEEPESVQETSDSCQHEDEYEEPKSVQVTSDFLEKHAVETSAFIQGALELNDEVNQMQSTSTTVTSKHAATNLGETDMKVRQNAENDCNSALPPEETAAEPVEINDAKLNEESQVPGVSEWKSSLFKKVEVKTIQSSPMENHQASVTMEEKEVIRNLLKAELEKEHLKRIGEAKEREREREKEKLAVERAIREVRERAFAEAKERAALERAAAEARQKNIDGRERLGKTAGQATEKTPAEKAAREAKLKAERAAVERATAEARARFLERALSEKAASDARNNPDKPDKNFHSKFFSHGARDSAIVFDGANGDSAQRCKARSERHQRIGERVAMALEEKNMRDRLVQKEQEERNRMAETLDADVKRWSSGKTGNLRALLSTLQYILGPDSGWQLIPLTDIVAATAVKKAYRKATLCVHPDKLQQRGATIQQKYICEKVFDLLKEAWNRFNMEER